MAGAAVRSGSSLYRDLAGRILEDVSVGGLAVGARLPGERVLAHRFAVSRGTVRQAIKVLELMGLVEVRLGSGAHVVSCPDAARPACPNKVPAELAHARLYFQPEVAALAATQVPAGTLADLAAVIDELAEPLNGCWKIGKADRKFHLAIAQATQNVVIEMCMHDLWPEPRTPAYAFNIPGPSPVLPPHALEAYEAVLSALVQRDPNAARAATQSHLAARLASAPVGCACQPG